MLKLADYRLKTKGLPDLLPYTALIAPGVVLCKDGSLLAAWKVRGRDTASSTYAEMAWISDRTNEAMKDLGNGWMLHMNAVREQSRAYPPEASGHFPDAVTRMIDNERLDYFRSDWCYSTTSVLTLTHKPDLQAARIARQTQGIEADLLAQNLERFTSVLRQVEDALAGVLELWRLEEREIANNGGESYVVSDLLAHLQHCLTGVNQPVRVPPVPMYLDAILGQEDLTLDGTTPIMGSRHIEVIALGGYPLESWPGMLSRLDGLPLEYRFSVRFIFLDQWEAVKEINKYRKGWQQQMTRFIDQITNKQNPRINRDASVMAEDAEQAELEVRSGMVGVGYLTAGIILMSEDRDELAEVAREVRRLLRSVGFMPRIETINALEAWLGSHPGNGYADLRRPLINTLNLADILPLAATWIGLAHNPCPFYPADSRCLAVLTTDGSTPFRFNLHEGDVGHTLIFGPTGSGKSTLLALLAAQFRAYEGASIFVFDKGLSMFALTRGAGGDHYDIGRDALSFAPLQHIDKGVDFSFATEWLAGMAELQKLSVLPAHRNAIHQALTVLAHNPEHMRSLTDFWHVLQDQELKEALRHYTRAGAMGTLLDASTDNLKLSPFNCFEIEALMEMGEANLIPVLLYLFHRIEQRLTGQPALLILDEAWVMLGHPVFRAKLREWLKVMRRANCAVVLATQSISDASRSGIFDVLVESTPTKILLANHAAAEEHQAKFYIDMGLNSRQIDIIARMMPKRDYYIVQPSGRRKIQLALGQKTLAFIGASGREEINRIQALIAEWPNDWQDVWLQERGAD